jgi:hypothetical protein
VFVVVDGVHAVPILGETSQSINTASSCCCASERSFPSCSSFLRSYLDKSIFSFPIQKGLVINIGPHRNSSTIQYIRYHNTFAVPPEPAPISVDLSLSSPAFQGRTSTSNSQNGIFPPHFPFSSASCSLLLTRAFCSFPSVRFGLWWPSLF